MTQKPKSTYDLFYEALTPAQKQKFEEGLIELLHSELVLARKHSDKDSIRKLEEAIAATENKLAFLRLR